MAGPRINFKGIRGARKRIIKEIKSKIKKIIKGRERLGWSFSELQLVLYTFFIEDKIVFWELIKLSG
jgi:hypothetical protein